MFESKAAFYLSYINLLAAVWYMKFTFCFTGTAISQLCLHMDSYIAWVRKKRGWFRVQSSDLVNSFGVKNFILNCCRSWGAITHCVYRVRQISKWMNRDGNSQFEVVNLLIQMQKITLNYFSYRVMVAPLNRLWNQDRLVNCYYEERANSFLKQWN